MNVTFAEPKTYTRWTDEEVDVFLACYHKHYYFLKGKELWTTIQVEMQRLGYEKSPWSLEKKWNNLLRRYRQGPGTGDTNSFIYYDKVHEIMQDKKRPRYLPDSDLPSTSAASLESHLPPETKPVTLDEAVSCTGMALQEMIHSYEREIETREKIRLNLLEHLQNLAESEDVQKDDSSGHTKKV
jgi:hypothetical protein